MTTAYDAFCESLDGPITGRDQIASVNLAALRQLQGAERDEARDLLIASLDKGDGRAPEALALIGDAASRTALEQALQRQGGLARVLTMKALIGLDALPDAEHLLARHLFDDPADTGKLEVVELLGRYRGGEARLALLAALRHPAYPVRFTAAQALLEQAGLTEASRRRDGTVGLALAHVVMQFDDLWREGAAAIEALVMAAAAGQAAPSEPPQGVSEYAAMHALEAIFQRAPAPGEHVDPALVRALGDPATSRAGQWGLLVLAQKLAERDPRAAELIGELGIERGRPWLESFVPRLRANAFGDAVRGALTRLGQAG